MQQYQFKYHDTTWAQMDDGVWNDLEEGHIFSAVFDYRFRNAKEFIPGYYQDSGALYDIRRMQDEDDLRAYAVGEWIRVNVTPAE